MNCARARFLIYAHLDRELGSADADFLARHVADCRACDARAASARGLARLLHSRLERRPVPLRLRERLHVLPEEPSPTRRGVPYFGMAAAVLLMLLPLASDTTPPTNAITTAGMVPAAAHVFSHPLVARRLTGTFVCLTCEAGVDETGRAAHAEHATGFCSDDGELWHLMPPDRLTVEGSASAVGRTATVEGVAFPESGFLRVSRVGY
jgi:hypothetical protein